MSIDRGRHAKPAGRTVSRRTFLAGSAAAVGGLALGQMRGSALAQAVRSGQSPVVQVRSRDVVTVQGVHEDVLYDMVSVVLRRLTGKETVAEAWSRFLGADDVVALKFDPVAAETLGTAPAMLRVLVRSLEDGGFDRSQLVAVDIGAAAADSVGIRSAGWGWTENEVDYGSGQDRLAAWLGDVTAIVNVASLKTHNITKVSGCLVNLAYSVVKHPATAFGKDGAPYVADIAALPQVRGKLRLNLIDASRVIFDGGPSGTDALVWDAGMVIGSPDPVAADTVGMHLINLARERAGLSPVGDGGGLAYLKAASERGLGVSRMYEIGLQKFKL